MSRALRIEFPDACYHVMNRGANYQAIFYNRKHKQIFLNLLADLHSDFSAEIIAYCLMPNHYHLLIRTPMANLSRIMRHLDGVYTQRFNRLNRRDGPLFRGRFKSIIVENNEYLLQLSRYIHLNPVKNEMVKYPDDYYWSSYRHYLKNTCDWLAKDIILNHFNKNLKAYIDFVMDITENNVDKVFFKKYLPTILGSKSFKARVMSYAEHVNESEIPDKKRIYKKPTLQKIIETVSVYYHINCEQLIQPQLSTSKKPRSMAIFLARQIGQHNLSQIAAYFKNISDAGVSNHIYRFKKQLENNSGLRKEAYDLRCRLVDEI